MHPVRLLALWHHNSARITPPQNITVQTIEPPVRFRQVNDVLAESQRQKTHVLNPESLHQLNHLQAQNERAPPMTPRQKVPRTTTTAD
jgi:hypothetical protein